jgi:hypothetical protein
MGTWNDSYREASKELDLAKEHYRIADGILAVATTRLNAAQKRLAELYRQRHEMINAQNQLGNG